MNKKLKRYTEDDRARAFSASNTPAVGAKGTKDNPYTQEEFEAMLEAGTWGGRNGRYAHRLVQSGRHIKG